LKEKCLLNKQTVKSKRKSLLLLSPKSPKRRRKSLKMMRSLRKGSKKRKKSVRGVQHLTLKKRSPKVPKKKKKRRKLEERYPRNLARRRLIKRARKANMIEIHLLMLTL
jgi:hypothetical protein